MYKRYERGNEEIMMNELRKPFHEELRMCLLEGTERLLRRKAALGEKVVYAHPDGTPLEMTAADALQLFLDRKESSKV